MAATAKFWDGIAEKYARTPIKDQASYEQTLERTASYLRQSDQVLELGCGTGTTALKLAGHAAVITASDLSAGMLAVGRRSAADQGIENVNFVQAEANTPPAGPFDVVMAFNLLHLVEDLDECLNQAQSVLKPSGLFISKTFCPPTKGGSLKYRVIRIMLPLMQFFGRAPFVRFLSDSELDATIEKAGFKIIERDNFPMTDPRHFVVARKL